MKKRTAKAAIIVVLVGGAYVAHRIIKAKNRFKVW